MKAKIYIGILLVLMLTGFKANAQRDNDGDYRHDDGKVVINNYYDNYDYYYSSRINRFHRSYSHFSYYAPVFTDAYWYNYQPYSWGMSIYGGGGFGLGYTESYPVYGYGVAYNSGWHPPSIGSSFYWGYDPFYYNSWYVTPVVNVSFGGFWPHTYYGYNGHDHHYSQHYYEVSQVHNGYNHYSNNYYNNNSNNYYSSNYSNSGHSSDRPPARSADTYSETSRRGAGGTVYRTNGSSSGNNGANGNNGNNGGNGNNGNNINGRATKSSTAEPSSFSNWNRNSSRSSSGTGSSKNQNGTYSNTRTNSAPAPTQNMRSRYPLTDPAKRTNSQTNQTGKRESLSSGSGSYSNSRSTSGSSSSGSVSKGKSTSGTNASDSQSPKSSESTDKPERRR